MSYKFEKPAVQIAISSGISDRLDSRVWLDCAGIVRLARGSIDTMNDVSICANTKIAQ